MARTPDQILADLGKLIAEDSLHGAELRVEIGNAVHRSAVYSLTAARATRMQEIARELYDANLWRNGKGKN